MHCVLPAGASGYIGSLLVEQLLRTTNVRRIYVLIRGKRGQPAKERLQRILHSGLFHLVRDDAALLQKVCLPEVFAHQCNAGQRPAWLHIHASCMQMQLHLSGLGLPACCQHRLGSAGQQAHQCSACKSKLSRNAKMADHGDTGPMASLITSKDHDIDCCLFPMSHAYRCTSWRVTSTATT